MDEHAQANGRGGCVCVFICSHCVHFIRQIETKEAMGKCGIETALFLNNI